MADQDIRKAKTHVNQNEALIFEHSSPGKAAFQLPPLDVRRVEPAEAFGSEYVRGEIENFPEVSEVEVVRHFTRLSTWNYELYLNSIFRKSIFSWHCTVRNVISIRLFS